VYLNYMVNVNEKLTQQVAHLARLELSQQEVELFTNQLNQVLQYVQKLQELDVKNVEPMVHPVSLDSYLREDIIQKPLEDSEGHPLILSSAPETLFEGFKVPPIL